jgi:hypothetical protein
MLSFKSNIEPTEKSHKVDFRNDKKEEALLFRLLDMLSPCEGKVAFAMQAKNNRTN